MIPSIQWTKLYCSCEYTRVLCNYSCFIKCCKVSSFLVLWKWPPYSRTDVAYPWCKLYYTVFYNSGFIVTLSSVWFNCEFGDMSLKYPATANTDRHTHTHTHTHTHRDRQLVVLQVSVCVWALCELRAVWQRWSRRVIARFQSVSLFQRWRQKRDLCLRETQQKGENK